MKKGIRIIASAILLVSMLTACGGKPTPTPEAANPGVEPVVVLPTAQPSEPCANEYMPVKENATYSYTSTGSPSGPFTFSRTMTNVRGDGFTVVSKVKNLEIVQDWSCAASGLIPSQMSATDATSMLAFEKFSDLKASNISGVFIPPTVTPGMEWTYALDIQGVENTKVGIPANMTGRVSVTYLAGNKESVTVPAGTFDAIAIEVNTVIDFEVTTQSNTVTLVIDSTYTIWYAPGVGWVKSSGHGKLGGQEYYETIVLDSYAIP